MTDLYRIETFCPTEGCLFRAQVRGCSSPDEAIDAGQALQRVHHEHTHPGTEDELTFTVYDGSQQEPPTGDGPVH